MYYLFIYLFEEYEHTSKSVTNGIEPFTGLLSDPYYSLNIRPLFLTTDCKEQPKLPSKQRKSIDQSHKLDLNGLTFCLISH